ncbi:MAG TPA: c-type cytochrome [Gammaproteobacteria bacterium]|jgi:mono/diheme cytochrome c family protein|nr:c-type cytochrome [Gammaproteobacteria bacterium]
MNVRILSAAAAAAIFVAYGVSAFDAVSLADYSGEEIFSRFCASCHGEMAHGDGPVARSLGVMVPDLTKITQRYGGFPTNLIRDTIDGRGARIDAHGTRTMPIWGYEFWVEEGGDKAAQDEMRKTIAKLVDYLRSIQADKVAANRD